MSLPQSSKEPMKEAMKQPKSLSIFFLTEMWERYGFYALQGTLAFFLTQQFGFSDVLTDATIGTFIAMLYITPILGGFIADKFLGFKHTIILGGLILCMGYGLLATTYDFTLVSLYFGCIAVGTGLLKANVSSLLGRIYQENDPRRDAGFTIFYVGINTGTLLAMGASGYLVEYLGWHWNFAIAAMGMLLSVGSFITGCRLFNIQDNQKLNTPLLKKFSAYPMAGVCILICAVLLKLENVATWVFIIAIFLSFMAVIYSGIGETKKQQRRLGAFILLAFLHCLFWAIYNQMFISFNLFISRAVFPNILGLHLPAPVFMGFEALGVIFFGGIFSHLWIRLSKTKFNPSTPSKFALSFVFIALALAVLLGGMALTNPALQLSPFWILLFYLIVAFGELCISPIGLAMVTRIATPRLAGMMMGVWLFTIGIGGKIAGYIATLAAIPSNIHTLPEIKLIYQHAFEKFLGMAAITFVIALLLIPVIRYLISGRFSGIGVGKNKDVQC
jgi:POT family proton-dependent oligopeptide transporter